MNYHRCEVSSKYTVVTESICFYRILGLVLAFLFETVPLFICFQGIPGQTAGERTNTEHQAASRTWKFGS